VLYEFLIFNNSLTKIDAILVVMRVNVIRHWPLTVSHFIN
jgi:hypothetical protein